MKIDWKKLALALGSVSQEKPYSESVSTPMAQAAMEMILGEETIKETVRFILDIPPGSGQGSHLAEQVLSLMQSEVAAKEAYRIYQISHGDRRSSAVALIKRIGAKISLNWVEEFLKNDETASWGIGVLDQLLWRWVVDPEEAETLLKLAENHPIENVREQALFIRQYLSNRERIPSGK